MSISVALAVGIRYAFSQRSSISFISGVAVAGLALSVAVLVVVVSVVNGFERELKERVFGMLPHLSLYGREPVTATSADLETIAAVPGVAGVASFVQGAGLAAVAKRVAGVLITGIDDDYELVSDLPSYLTPGARLHSGGFGLFLGAGVARDLDVGIGDRVTLVLPSATVTPAGLFPRQKRFEVRGIVQSRSEVDGRAVYVHQEDARRLFRLGQRVHGYQLRVDDLFAVDQIARQVVLAVGSERFFSRSWIRTHGTIYHAISVQKTTMFVLLSFLVGVAAFNLVSTLVMVVDQRSSDVAILRTLGSDSTTVVLAFVLLGLCLGALGVGGGLLTGALVAWTLPDLYGWFTRSFELNLMSEYFIYYLPVEIRLSDLGGIAITALLLCVGSTLYPAWRAVQLKPSEVLAHE